MDIDQLIDNIATQNYSKASEIFNELLQDKMTDALDQEKIAVAGQIFNGEDPDDEQLEMDFESDDDLEDMEDDDQEE